MEKLIRDENLLSLSGLFVQYSAIGYHGCPRSRLDKLEETGQWPQSLTGWLGEGVYFWDNDPSTGRWWAKDNYDDQEPTVIRAEIDLSDCLDFTNVFAQNALKRLRNLKEENPQVRKELTEWEDRGYTEEGALIHLARKRVNREGPNFSATRVPVHMAEEKKTMKTVGSTPLLVSFRMVILVHDTTNIGDYEVLQ